MPSKTAKRASKRGARLPPELSVKKARRNPNPPPKEHQFKPGVSGNPGGIPKATRVAAVILSKAYLAALAQLVPGDPQGRTYAELVASGQLVAAAKGQTPAAVEIRKATEGDRIAIDVSRLSDDELDARLEDVERATASYSVGETETATDSGGEGASPDTAE